MLGIYPDFDDDLLFDALGLLDLFKWSEQLIYHKTVSDCDYL
jgi:hypothetical protein